MNFGDGKYSIKRFNIISIPFFLSSLPISSSFSYKNSFTADVYNVSYSKYFSSGATSHTRSDIEF